MSKITNLLGDQAAFYLEHTCSTIDKSLIHIPSSSTIDDTWISSDRNIRTLSSIQTLLGHGRLANTGYVSILPVDQGIEHTAGASFAPNPLYFDPENIFKHNPAGSLLADNRRPRPSLHWERCRKHNRDYSP